MAANKWDAFTVLFLATQVGIAILYWTVTEYDDSEVDPITGEAVAFAPANDPILYNFYIRTISLRGDRAPVLILPCRRGNYDLRWFWLLDDLHETLCLRCR